MKKFIKIVVALVVLAGIYFWFSGDKSNKDIYTTTKIVRGDIVERITASGIINPISTINIGTQVSGTIRQIYVDYNTPVKKNQIMAQIDPSLFEATVAQRRAALNVAKAQVEVVKNDIEFNKKHLDRIKKLNTSKYSADKELESAERDYRNSVVQLDLQRAQVKQAEASLQTAEIDLKYTRIVSPVDGIVISKEVEVGQTVAASFQTPTLFNVAEDLTKMEISASIVEADIAKVKEGQIVEFNVDSFQDEIFYGIVTQVRNDPITVQNVVTYDVIIEINNTDLRLKPGMTANVSIITAEKADVLLVPNQALRFYVQETDGTIKRYKDKGLWVFEDGKLKRIPIRTGVYDEEKSEVISDKLKEGMSVILEKKASGAKKSNVRMRL
ncbi:MAG: efflux RND transporter periplasmic adaptor subunit [Lactobacillus sp.]|jgi:HlyD family secretion protein|nr:efflux RND transporter periplasmic adaptor subunit [Lactobacillus sp.]